MDKYQKEVKTPLEAQKKAPRPWTPPVCGYVLIYSRILDDFLLLTDTHDRAGALRAQGIEDVIYTVGEVGKLKEKNEDELRAIHKVKKAFPASRIAGWPG